MDVWKVMWSASCLLDYRLDGPKDGDVTQFDCWDGRVDGQTDDSSLVVTQRRHTERWVQIIY